MSDIKQRSPVYTINDSNGVCFNWKPLLEMQAEHGEISTINCHAVVEKFHAVKLPPTIVDLHGQDRIIHGTKAKCEAAITAWEMEQKMVQILDAHFRTAAEVNNWLNSPCAQLGNAVPADLLRANRHTKVMSVLVSLSDYATG